MRGVKACTHDTRRMALRMRACCLGFARRCRVFPTLESLVVPKRRARVSHWACVSACLPCAYTRPTPAYLLRCRTGVELVPAERACASFDATARMARLVARRHPTSSQPRPALACSVVDGGSAALELASSARQSCSTVARKLVKQRQSMPRPPTHATTPSSPSARRTLVSNANNEAPARSAPNGNRRPPASSRSCAASNELERPISDVPSRVAPLKKRVQPSLKARNSR